MSFFESPNYIKEFNALTAKQKKFIISQKFKTIEDVFKIFPQEKKYIHLVNKYLSEKTFIKNLHHFVNASFLIKNEFNKDIVFNFISQVNSDELDQEQIISKNIFKLLLIKYTPQKVCELVFNTTFSKYVLKEIVRGYSELKTLILENSETQNLNLSKERQEEYLKKSLRKQPKSFNEIHDYLFNCVSYERDKSGVTDYSLNQREDFLKLQNQEIIVNNEIFIIDVPRTRFDLVNYSRHDVFNNCIGKSEKFAEQCVQGSSAIIGIFDKNKKPKYCILTGKYSFKQAKAVSNDSIPQDVYFALEKQLTLTPTIPDDFIKIEHSFIFGYKYNPEKGSLFLMFKPRGDKIPIYEYFNVEFEVYEDFVIEDKKGSFLNSTIKKYGYDRIA